MSTTPTPLLPISTCVRFRVLLMFAFVCDLCLFLAWFSDDFVDDLLAAQKDNMAIAFNQLNTQGFMEIFSNTIETCISDFAQLNKDDRKGFFGRNTLNVRYMKQDKAKFEFDQTESFKNDSEQHRLRSQYSRLNHVRGCAKKLLLNKNFEIGYKHNIQYHIRKNMNRL